MTDEYSQGLYSQGLYSHQGTPPPPILISGTANDEGRSPDPELNATPSSW